LANLGGESETCVGSRVHLVGVSISFEKNFYRLLFTPPSLVHRIGPSRARAARARPRRNEGRGACGASRKRGENGRHSPGSQLGHWYQTRGNDPTRPGRAFFFTGIKHALCSPAARFAQDRRACNKSQLIRASRARAPP
jgi:hypothetical protein